MADNKVTLRSKKTNLEHNVTEKEWEQMRAQGDGRKYTVVSDNKKAEAPLEVADKQYENLLKQGNTLLGKKQYKEAKETFLKAAKINETELVTQKIAECEQNLAK